MIRDLEEIETFYQKIKKFYMYPQQLVFVDETSKDGRHALRRYAWSKKGSKAVVTGTFSRGERVSIFAACDTQGKIKIKKIKSKVY